MQKEETVLDKKVKVGLIGCGNISSTYIKVMRTFAMLELVACSDRVPERAQAQAAAFCIPRVCSTEELLNDPEIDIVVNLTPPGHHASIALAALEAGKSVYNEKPLAVTREEAQQLLETARTKGLRIGCAPDTFLGAGLQTCIHLITSGAIGIPLAAVGHLMWIGPEVWHPEPDFFYQPGGGPLFDMGPYFLTAFISMLGPIKRVCSSTRLNTPQRRILSQPHHGRVLQVEIPTHVVGILDFVSGPVATLITSFDVLQHNLPWMEVYGTEGVLSVPDPHTFGGPVRIHRYDHGNWKDVPLTNSYSEDSRGIGIADMAHAIRTERMHRANAEVAYHVLDTMHALLESSKQGRHIELSSTCESAPLLEPDHHSW